MRGQGKPGFCSVCAHTNVADINAKVREGLNAAQLSRWTEERFGFKVHRSTWYSHKPHALSPEQRVIQAAETQRQALAIKRGSNTGFLEAVRDIGLAKAIDNPDQVSIDHALKAVSILENRKDRTGDSLNVLINIAVGQIPAYEVVEGAFKEV